jgi:hypothetical protein
MNSVDDLSQSVSLAEWDIDSDERHRQMRREEIVDEIASRDAGLVSAFGRVCPDCGGKLYRHGRTHPKEVWSLAGLVKVSLVRLRCPACRRVHVPASYLIADPLLSSLAQKFIALCQDNPFAVAAGLLKELLGIDIPVMTLHAFVRRQSAYFDDEVRRATEEFFATGQVPASDVELEAGSPLYLAVDEGLMHEWSYCRGREERAEKKSFVTAYTAVFFDGRACLSSPRVAPDKRRYALTNRYGHASATTGIDQFFSELVWLSWKRGRSFSAPLFILTDGARYLKSAIESYFPGAVALLDLFHLRARIEELICAESPYWQRLGAALRTYDARALFELVKNYTVCDEALVEKKKRLLLYIARNAGAIHNHRHPRCRVHGSSAAEKAVDTLIARRFKRRGMSWTDAGCEALLYFRLLTYNRQWKNYWQRRHNMSGPGAAATETEPVCVTAPEVGACDRGAKSRSYAKERQRQPVRSQTSHATVKPVFYHQVRLADDDGVNWFNNN